MRALRIGLWIVQNESWRYVERRVLSPVGWWEYGIVALAALVVVFAFVWFVLGFLRRGEQDLNHIKYTILSEDFERWRGEDGQDHED